MDINKKIDKKTVIIILLSILVIALAGILAWGWYANYMANVNLFYYRAGYTQCISDAVSQGQNCQPVRLFFGNMTYDYIDIKCLQSASK